MEPLAPSPTLDPPVKPADDNWSGLAASTEVPRSQARHGRRLD
jgi:hypothetical protein